MGHPLASRRRLPAAAVAQGPLLALERGSQSRALFDDLFRHAGVAPQIVMELGSIEVLKRFVEIGFGMALVPAIAVTQEVESGRLIAITATGVTRRSVGLVLHRPRVAAAAALLNQMRGQLSGTAS